MKIKNRNRNKRKNPKDRMRIDNRNIHILEEAKRKRWDQIIKKRRKRKDEQLSVREVNQ